MCEFTNVLELTFCLSLPFEVKASEIPQKQGGYKLQTFTSFNKSLVSARVSDYIKQVVQWKDFNLL